MNETKSLGTERIIKLIAKFAIPAVVASLINAIYNVVDRIFLAHYEPENVLGGLQAGFPIMLFMLGVALLCAIGFSTLSSIYLGRKEEGKANKIFVNGLVCAVIFTVLMTVLGVLLIKPLLRFTGAVEANIRYAEDYMLIIIYAQFFQMISMYLANYARIEGRPNLSMISQVVAAVVNIILDYVFIGPLHLGVKGAAYGTIIGLFVGMMILVVYYFFMRKSIFRFRWKDCIPDFRLIGSALAIGVSSFIMQIGNVVSNIAMNNAIVKYGGEASLNALAALSSIFTLVLMPLIGIKDGAVPIIGYNYGAGKIDRAKKALVYSIVIGCIFSTVLWLFIEIWPEGMLSLFFDPASPTAELAVLGLRLDFAMLPLIAINICGTAYLQSTKRTIAAFFASTSRQILFLLPCTFLLPLAWGLTGVWLSFPVSDFLSIVLASVLLFVAFRKQKETPPLESALESTLDAETSPNRFAEAEASATEEPQRNAAEEPAPISVETIDCSDSKEDETEKTSSDRLAP